MSLRRMVRKVFMQSQHESRARGMDAAGCLMQDNDLHWAVTLPSRLIGRRELLAAGAAGVIAFAVPVRALSRPTLDQAIRTFAGGAEVRDGRVQLEIPPLVENGNAVGVTVSVDSPMSATNHVRRIALLNEKNPQADVAVFQLGPRAGRAKVATRIRLAASQVVVGIAEMSDGSFWSSKANVIVTLAACIEDISKS